VPPERLIEACRRERPDIIGLSGLLVKSAQQMVATVQDLKAAGIDVPVLVGGAALTGKFVKTRIAPEYGGIVLYAKDAMQGLELANRLMDPAERERLELERRRETAAAGKAAGRDAGPTAPPRPSGSGVSRDVPGQVPPDCEPHIYRDYPIRHLFPYLNWQMLLGHHLGVKGQVEELIRSGDAKTVELKETVDRVLGEAAREGLIRAHGLYRFFPAQSSGDSIFVYDPADRSRVLVTFTFPRQKREPGLCLADFVQPVDSGKMDYVGFFVVTAGEGIAERAAAWREKGDYLRSHVLQAAALELAEAFAERMHQMMRDAWGFPDPPDMTMKERFGARYRGIRVSFGYPACPNLEDQEQLFALLRPEQIGVRLTEGCMMEPEASVSAMVFAHPEARYFSVE